MEFQKTTFTPGEEEAISGVSVMTQRNLRRFGYMTKSGKGWTRFSIEETARLLVLGKLLEIGVALAESDDLIRRAKNAGLMVMAFAFGCPGAIFDPNNIAGGEKPLKYPPGFLRKFLISLPKHHLFENDMGAFYSTAQDELSVALVLDLQRLGRLFVERSPRPLVTVAEAG